MRAPNNYVRTNGTATLFASGAAGQTIDGTAISTRNVELASLSSLVVVVAKTSTTTFTAKWQVSDDGSTYYDVASSNNAANVAVATGTGSSVTTSKVLDAPASIYAWNWARVRVITAVSTTDGTVDGATVSYRHLKDRF